MPLGHSRVKPKLTSPVRTGQDWRFKQPNRFRAVVGLRVSGWGNPVRGNLLDRSSDHRRGQLRHRSDHESRAYAEYR